MRVRSLHLGLSALCAVASVGLAAVQTFRAPAQPPVEVRVVAADPATAGAPVAGSGAASETEAVTAGLKGDSVTVVTPDDASFQKAAALEGAVFMPGTKPEQMQRYDVKALFDGNPATRVTLGGGDSEFDFILQFPAADGVTVTGIEVSVPPDVASEDAPLTVDAMVLPTGTMEGGGRSVLSFSIEPSKPVQSFAIPATRGKGVWLHIANRQGAPQTVIGDLRIFTSIVQ